MATGSAGSTRERVPPNRKNDSTCTVGGRVFEVPPHLRGGKVTLYYQVLRPDTLWLEDGGTRVPVREVDAVANSRRPRVCKTKPQEAPKATGLMSRGGVCKRWFPRVS